MKLHELYIMYLSGMYTTDFSVINKGQNSTPISREVFIQYTHKLSLHNLNRWLGVFVYDGYD